VGPEYCTVLTHKGPIHCRQNGANSFSTIPDLCNLLTLTVETTSHTTLPTKEITAKREVNTGASRPTYDTSAARFTDLDLELWPLTF